jgi:hypothetical protein
MIKITNISDVRRDLAKIADAIGKSADQVFRQMGFDLLAEVKRKSPVDTGTFKKSWQVGVNGIGNGKPIESAEIGDIIYISNHLPYAPVIEYGLYPGQGPKTTADGYSTQAPRGVARMSAIKIRRKYMRAAKKL